jgi:peptidoglycan-associated lipoprotein
MGKMIMATHSTYMKALCLGALMALAGCANKPVAVAAAAPPIAPAARPTAPSVPPPAIVVGIIPGSAQDLHVNVGDTIHFAFNEYSIEDTDKGTLQKQVAWLARYPRVRVTIEGHADERGTREFNLALGARRAAAAKEYLVSLGVSTTRVDTISYGKERPICTDSNESCWAQNRRGVTIIAGGAPSS